jgi:hypothetical protein
MHHPGEERDVEATATRPSESDDQLIFPPSRLWLGTLGIIVASVAGTIAIMVATGSAGAWCVLFLGVAVFGPAMALFYSVRREVVLNDEGVIVRPPNREPVFSLPWDTIADVFYEYGPSNRYYQVRIALTDGGEKIITEHQVRKLRQIATVVEQRRTGAQ